VHPRHGGQQAMLLATGEIDVSYRRARRSGTTS
jgi:hypothetical protein